MMKILKFLLSILVTISLTPTFADSLSTLPPYHCPAATEIVRKNEFSLKAITNQNGLSMEWIGWLQSDGLPAVFTGVFFLGSVYITCQYEDAKGNYGQMGPIDAKYKAAGIESGPWTGVDMTQECHSHNPAECVFLIK